MGLRVCRFRIDPLRFLAGWRKRHLNEAFSFVLVQLDCACVRLLYYVCVHVYVGSISLYFVFFCVGLIDFDVNFCCPYQCK